jgi:hypothetical protein
VLQVGTGLKAQSRYFLLVLMAQSATLRLKACYECDMHLSGDQALQQQANRKHLS